MVPEREAHGTSHWALSMGLSISGSSRKLIDKQPPHSRTYVSTRPLGPPAYSTCPSAPHFTSTYFSWAALGVRRARMEPAAQCEHGQRSRSLSCFTESQHPLPRLPCLHHHLRQGRAECSRARPGQVRGAGVRAPAGVDASKGSR